MAKRSSSRRTHYVYWLYDNHCTDVWKHGYVGVSSNINGRIGSHRYNSLFPKNFSRKILYIGTEKDCLLYEYKLRPTSNIGWNKVHGGGNAGPGHVKKSPEHKAKIRAAALARWAKKGAKEKHSRVCKEAFETIDRSGPNNGMFGHKHSKTTKKKISKAQIERLNK